MSALLIVYVLLFLLLLLLLCCQSVCFSTLVFHHYFAPALFSVYEINWKPGGKGVRLRSSRIFVSLDGGEKSKLVTLSTVMVQFFVLLRELVSALLTRGPSFASQLFLPHFTRTAVFARLL
jgi:hypothetical protein